MQSLTGGAVNLALKNNEQVKEVSITFDESKAKNLSVKVDKLGKIVFLTGRFVIGGSNLSGNEAICTGFPTPVHNNFEFIVSGHTSKKTARLVMNNGALYTVFDTLNANETYTIIASSYIAE